MLCHKSANSIILLLSSSWGNRLAPLVSAMRLAELSGRDLQVIWNPTNLMPCPIERVFKPFFNVRPFDIGRVEYDVSSDTNPGSLLAFVDLSVLRPIYLFTFKYVFPISECVSSFDITPELANKLRPYAWRLPFSDEVLGRVDEYKGLSVGAVGVHLRKRDMPGFRYRPPDDAVFGFLDRTYPNERFFLCTDCLSTERLFVRRYGDRVSLLSKRFPPSLWDASASGPHEAFVQIGVEAAVEALVDLLLLSMTTRIIGNTWSSFSYFAAFLGNIPVQYI